MRSPETARTDDSEEQARFTYRHSPEVVDFLNAIGASILVSTYQAGKLAVFRSHEERLSMLPRTFDQAMGIAVAPGHESGSNKAAAGIVNEVAPGRLAIASKFQIWTLRNSPSVAKKLNESDEFTSERPYDACYMPRTSHVTGNIDTHEMAWGRAARTSCGW